MISNITCGFGEILSRAFIACSYIEAECTVLVFRYERNESVLPGRYIIDQYIYRSDTIDASVFFYCVYSLRRFMKRFFEFEI